MAENYEIWPVFDEDDNACGAVLVLFGQSGSAAVLNVARYLRGTAPKALALLWAAACSALPADNRLARNLAKEVFDLLDGQVWLRDGGAELQSRLRDLETYFEGRDHAQARALYDLVRHAAGLPGPMRGG
jgi:hypothetical protein